MTAPTRLRLGTRSSLLAAAQSRQVAAELEAAHPGLQVELVFTDTRGDRDLQTPLTEVQDPDFFSAELDRALLDNEVDFCVHSWKDLDRKRPSGIVTAAIPERADPRDVILFRPDVQERLAAGNPLRIGTCSLRRQINIGDFLPAALPQLNGQPQLEFAALRGAVDARVKQIDAAAGDARLDGVVIALAGLIRLWNDTAGNAAIRDILDDARWMVLPLGACPTAAGQGALAIECRANDGHTKQLLAAIHRPQVAARVNKENSLLDTTSDNATACGATVLPVAELKHVAWLRGRNSAGHAVQATSSGNAIKTDNNGGAWDDSGWRAALSIETITTELPTAGAVFAAHWRALAGQQLSPQVRCWTSGISSWKKLAAQGIWVEGCADNLGVEFVEPLLQESVLQLPPLKDWTALTHADAVDSWTSSRIGQATATYRSAVNDTARLRLGTELENFQHFYWTSSRQFAALRDWLPEDAQHACGTGKTLVELRAAGINVQPFVSRREWQQWLA